MDCAILADCSQTDNGLLPNIAFELWRKFSFNVPAKSWVMSLTLSVVKSLPSGRLAVDGAEIETNDFLFLAVGSAKQH